MKTYEIIGPDGKVHYTRPQGHPDLKEAESTAGYSIREKQWKVNPDYAKAQGEVVLLSPEIPVGECEYCRFLTNGRLGDGFVCSFCRESLPYLN